MDIKSLDDSLTGRPPVSQTGDLLAQLKAAGTIEAEVIKVLQDKLLLSSRLGDILTTNSLNYKVGDQLNLRLAGSAQNPVLKASPRHPVPVTLDIGQNLRLNRALPVDQAVLAIVTRVAAQRIEIRLAEQILTLPRQPGVARGQLLSLQRNNANRTIEITAVERKLIYKALLKQLVPRQSDPGPVSLIKLLNLVNRALIAPPAKVVPVAELVPNPVRGEPALAESRPVTLVAKDQALTTPGKPRDISKPENPARLAVVKTPQLLPATTPGLKPIQAEIKIRPAGNNRQINALLRQINKPGDKPADPVNVVKPAVSGPTSRVSIGRAVFKSNTRVTAINDNGNVGTTAASTAKMTPAPMVPAGIRSTFESRAIILDHQPNGTSQMPQTRGTAPQSVKTSAPSVIPTTLQMLLQWVPRLAEMNVTQIKQWFEFASLIRTPKSKATLTAAIDPVRSLNKLIDQASFSRELTQSIQPRIKSTAGDDAPTTKTLPQEVLQQYARDGIKLVEQSLSYNLLQRASLGLQQETQQPLALSLVLPFLEGQEVKPIQIDLAQRDQPREDNDNGWDIRLSFEFEGLGPISCHLFLEGRAVTASFYSEHDQTRNRIEQALPELKQQLRSAGFTNCEFHSFPGTPANTRPTATASYSESLIDIEV